MAGNPPPEGLGDDFFEQILAAQPGYGGGGGGGRGEGMMMMGLQLGSGAGGMRGGNNNNNSNNMGGMMPLGLNLEHHGFMRHHPPEDHSGAGAGGLGLDSGILNNNNHNNAPPSSSATSGISERDSVHMAGLFTAFGQLQQQQSQSIRAAPPPPPQLHQPFQSQQNQRPVSGGLQPPSIRPRVRARRGQATDPHSIAERLRRERIAERMKALQELVPTVNKTDRAAMLDEIVDYVKFLRLQVKVLSMSRLGAAGAVAQLVADVPASSLEGEGGGDEQAWEKWSNDGTEQQVAKLMEEDIGAAMQFLQSKALCIMPISLASAIFRAHPAPPEPPSAVVKPESNAPS